MADKKQYVFAIGFVQFPPNEREANGKDVIDLVIKTQGGDGKFVRVTVWPELLLETPIEQGDLVAVEGAFSSSTYQNNEGQQRTSLQISAYNLNVNGEPIKRQEREVVTAEDTDSF